MQPINKKKKAIPQPFSTVIHGNVYLCNMLPHVFLFLQKAR